jgi:lipid A ethanolaminephosphotransferase
LAVDRLDGADDPVLCANGRCMDEILLSDLPARVRELDQARPGDRVIVLHQLGNHGPSYFERYPAAFRRFTPTCDTPELGDCSREQIVNSYDNAVLYTDHFLARAIDLLRNEPGYDSALVYVSDHGESLGENGLFLHGVPQAIAPSQQTHVPMVMWFSPGFVSDSGLDLACLRREAAQPASHDNLFPSVLGLLQVRTEAYRRDDDLFATCRSPV